MKGTVNFGVIETDRGLVPVIEVTGMSDAVEKVSFVADIFVDSTGDAEKFIEALFAILTGPKTDTIKHPPLAEQLGDA